MGLASPNWIRSFSAAWLPGSYQKKQYILEGPYYKWKINTRTCKTKRGFGHRRHSPSKTNLKMQSLHCQNESRFLSHHWRLTIELRCKETDTVFWLTSLTYVCSLAGIWFVFSSSINCRGWHGQASPIGMAVKAQRRQTLHVKASWGTWTLPVIC